MAIQISDDSMTMEVDAAVITTARFSQDAAADGNGARIVSTDPRACSTATAGATQRATTSSALADPVAVQFALEAKCYAPATASASASAKPAD